MVWKRPFTSLEPPFLVCKSKANTRPSKTVKRLKQSLAHNWALFTLSNQPLSVSGSLHGGAMSLKCFLNTDRCHGFIKKRIFFSKEKIIPCVPCFLFLLLSL